MATATERTPWLLFMPSGRYDGLIWSPETADAAGRRLFGSNRAWESMQRKGWTIRRGEPGEHLRLTQQLIDEMNTT